MKITVLGSGPSYGIPGVAVGWGKCNPDNPKNRRLRSSITVEHEGTEVLIDTSPDLRQQLLQNDKKRFDALLYTHFHADHLNGLDEVRSINQVLGKPLDTYCDGETLKAIQTRFGYVLEPLAQGVTFFYKPTLKVKTIKQGDQFEIGSLKIDVFIQDHGHCDTLGFKFNDTFAYSTDVTRLPDAAFEVLEGVKVWIIGVLTDKDHVTHAHVAKALKWAERIGPERVYLTHLGQDLDYEELDRNTPENVRPAHDGLVIIV